VWRDSQLVDVCCHAVDLDDDVAKHCRLLLLLRVLFTPLAWCLLLAQWLLGCPARGSGCLRHKAVDT
jgi:hypothetical protein